MTLRDALVAVTMGLVVGIAATVYLAWALGYLRGSRP